MSQHYFSSDPASEFRLREIEVELAGATRTLVTAGGVFSPEHIDVGTEILLKTIDSLDSEQHLTGNILDLGCGWGPIALATALANSEATVWAVDVNERARELTQTNATKLGLTNIRVVTPGEVPADISFNTIRSNPPIRVGKAALHEMLTLWLPRLVPGGNALLVVAKHLGADSLQKWIANSFEQLSVDRIARDKGFYVIEAVVD